MMHQTQDAVIRTRIDATTKKQAADALAGMGLSISDAVRILLVRVAEEKRLPFEVKVPNKETLEAMAELDAGKGHRARTVNELMAALNADD